MNELENTHLGDSGLDLGSGVDYADIVMGDDGVLMSKVPLDRDAMVFHYARLGLKAKISYYENPNLVEFCSGYFWHSSGGRVWGPKPGRFLAKIGYSVNEQRDPSGWMAGVLIGVKQDVSHVPILNTLVSHCLELLGNKRVGAVRDEHKFHVGRAHKPTAETYQQFYDIYGCSPADYDSLKNYILSIKTLPFLMDHPLLEKMVATDC
jgi:hypothetical protein